MQVMVCFKVKTLVKSVIAMVTCTVNYGNGRWKLLLQISITGHDVNL